MKTFKLTCFLFALFSSFYSSADHLAGGYFEYTCLGGNEYQIDYYFLRDCSGADAPDTIALFLKNDCGTACYHWGYINRVDAQTVDYGCGDNCPLGLHTGDREAYRIYHFKGEMTLPGVCDSWTLSTAISARNTVDYANGGDQIYYNYCKINNTVQNNSVTLQGANLLVGCAGSPATALFSLHQTGGDQMVFDFVPSMYIDVLAPPDYCEAAPVEYEEGLSQSQTFPSTAPFALDNSTGTFSFTPTTQGRSYFAVRAREYRSGVFIGEIVIDGMVYVTNCEGSNEVTFHSFPVSGDNVMTVSAAPGTYCQTLTLTSDETIENVTIEAPPYVTYSVHANTATNVQVTLCAAFPPGDNICDQVDVGVVVKAISGQSDDCLANANHVPDKGYYIIRKEAGEYCPENLYFTNRNDSSNIPMPIYAHAEERIWVGDSMPVTYNPQIQGEEGPVTVEDGTTLVAGTEIILPSCDIGTACVTLEGDVTLIILPNSCSADCQHIPLDVSVTELFKCGNEQLIVNASGNGPFTYQLQILGHTYISNNPYFNIHNIISEEDNGQNPYTVNVYDAIGSSGTFRGEILGTKIFYDSITKSAPWIDYPDNAGEFWTDGNYYAGNVIVGQVYDPQMGQWTAYLPFYLYDDINAHGPWYGATKMDLVVWDRWGNGQQSVYEIHKDLEDGEDWSFNQGEIYWNGHWDNDLTSGCAAPYYADMFNYVLEARNCFTEVHVEVSPIIDGGCFNAYWIPQETKSYTGADDDAIWVDHAGLRWLILKDDEVACYPNPASKEVYIQATETMHEIKIIDVNGKIVRSIQCNSDSITLEVSQLSNGVYTILVSTDGGERHTKLIKN